VRNCPGRERGDLYTSSVYRPQAAFLAVRGLIVELGMIEAHGGPGCGGLVLYAAVRVATPPRTRLLMLLRPLGDRNPHVLPPGAESSCIQVQILVILSGDGGTGIMVLRDMQGDQAISLVCYTPHVCRVVF
jgi:hypothetical protein